MFSNRTRVYSYGFNGKENDPETVGTGQGTQDYGLRIYNPSLGRFLSVDPLTAKYPFYTPYQFAGNMPIKYIDLDGAEPAEPGTDSKEVQKSSVWADGKEGEKDHFWQWSEDHMKWNDLGNKGTDRKVTDAVGDHLMSSNNFKNSFEKYINNPDFGSLFFFAAANTYETPESGIMKQMTDMSGGQFGVVNQSINMSNMTHDWVAKAGGTKIQNMKEHMIGMFLISSVFGTSAAEIIGDLNEVRGLIITDRQNGNMGRALRGEPAKNGGPTGFEYTDLIFNEMGRQWYRNYKESLNKTEQPLQKKK